MKRLFQKRPHHLEAARPDVLEDVETLEEECRTKMVERLVEIRG